jgi:hypothetical protein
MQQCIVGLCGQPAAYLLPLLPPPTKRSLRLTSPAQSSRLWHRLLSRNHSATLPGVLGSRRRSRRNSSSAARLY